MKISYGLRAFGIYFIVLGALLWFTLDNALERLNDGMRQSAESVLVDMANVLAEVAITPGDTPGSFRLDPARLDNVLRRTSMRTLTARIYNITKTEVDSTVRVTDAQGIVIYDSSGQHVGEDFSRWNDVVLTLRGEYGARTSYLDQNFTEPDDPKAMIVAAPVLHNGDIIGVLSVSKPINSLEGHLVTESNQLKRYAFVLLLLALLIGYLLSLWFTWALGRIANYANAMAAAKNVAPPQFLDSRLAELAESIANMRGQLDGKEYVEAYIHSLTHELKTPITSIGGAVELLAEDLPAADRQRFLQNIQTSNQRMSRLVDRMLSLARLEALTELVDVAEFDLSSTVQRLLNERHSIGQQKDLSFALNTTDAFTCHGDRVLISQAIANLLDNAIRFSNAGGVVDIRLEKYASPDGPRTTVSIYNAGQPIPEFALDKVFDRFFSLPGTQPEQDQSKSTGLGLSFVKEIMELHNGTVRLENTRNGVLASLQWPDQSA